MVKKILWVIPVLLFVSLIQPAQADADRYDRHDRGRDRHYDRGHNHHHYGRYYGHGYPYGRSVVVLPRGYFSFVVGGGRYYYSAGVFYSNRGRDYVVVNPPRGAVVRIVPPDCDRVIIRGATYYTSNGVYYRRISSGYQVVEVPVEDDEPEVVVAPSTGTKESFTINIANGRGGYTAVVLKKSGSGFTGPQGEFYPEFPSVEQLKAMYAK